MPPNLQETPNLSTFTEEILNRKLHFLCSVTRSSTFILLIISETPWKALRTHSVILHSCIMCRRHSYVVHESLLKMCKRWRKTRVYRNNWNVVFGKHLLEGKTMWQKKSTRIRIIWNKRWPRLNVAP